MLTFFCNNGKLFVILQRIKERGLQSSLSLILSQFSMDDD